MRHAVLLVACLLAVSCARDPGPPVAVSELRVFAPLPGSSAGVAYMTIENRVDTPVTVLGARSPQFDRIEIHESLMEDGVMKMRPVGELVVGAGDRIVFEEGGKHFMLMDANPDVAVGTSTTLEISHDQGLLVVAATLQSRVPAE